MQQLIKLSDTYYIVVDDSEIKEGDFDYSVNYKTVTYVDEERAEMHMMPVSKGLYKNVTHSTEKLYSNDFWKTNELNLSDIEEVINEYSVEKMAEPIKKQFGVDCEYWYYKKGFNAHKELTKDKLFNIEDVRNILYSYENYEGDSIFVKDVFEDVITKYLSPTEWDIEIDEQGKISLI